MMGYTHYWTVSKPIVEAETWKKIIDDVRVIVSKSPAPLAREFDNTTEKPHIDGAFIAFNGIGDNGHETFWVSRVNDRKPRYVGDNPQWSFCKTAHKPYDVTVTAILAYLDSVWPNFYSVTSDGEPEEWQAGIDLAKAALPEKDNIISVPRKVRKEAV
jgi:hypothetical protein